MKLRTLEELFVKVKSGEIKEAELTVMVDNDNTYFTTCDKEGMDKEIIITRAGGYEDVLPLYELLFPKATVGKA